MDALLGGPLTRWHAASAGAFLEANAGLQYVFGDVSGSLRTQLGYTQRQIDGLGTAKARHARSAAALPRSQLCVSVRARAPAPSRVAGRERLRLQRSGRGGAHG